MNNDPTPQGQPLDDYELREEYDLSQVPVVARAQQSARPFDIKQLTENTETLADFLADSIGVLHSSEYIPGGAHLSEATGKTFTDMLIKKRQQGYL